MQPMMHPVRVPDRVVGADKHSAAEQPPVGELPRLTGVAELFHQLNNQLGIILANAELLEAKATDAMNRARAAQRVTSTLDAMGTAREIRRQTDGSDS